MDHDGRNLGFVKVLTHAAWPQQDWPEDSEYSRLD
jgi:hypothetical protein